ncbi:MAG: ABC transporter permease [Chthoniobacterales bacterium]
MILAQLRSELYKLFARKRTYMGFVGFFGVELLVLFLLRLERVRHTFEKIIQQNGYIAEYYMSGLTLGLLILLWTVFLLGALYLALVGGDLIAKEIEDGTMRMTLCRPVSRFRIICLKVSVATIYTFSLTLFISLTALATGWIQSGSGGLFVFAPLEKLFALYEWSDGLWRYFLAIPFLAFSLMTITSLALFFSCFKMKPAAATILTLSFFFVDTILRNIPYFESIRVYFVTSRMSTWSNVFHYRIPWENMIEDYAWLLAINISLLMLGYLVFQSRDLKS